MRREVFLKIRVFFIELRAISTSLDLMEVLQESPSEIIHHQEVDIFETPDRLPIQRGEEIQNHLEG